MKLDNSDFNDFTIDGYLPPIKFLVSTTSKGLLYFDGQGCTRILDVGLSYGITKHEQEWWVYCQGDPGGCIVSFNISDQKGYNLRERIVDLEQTIHQIDFVGDELVVMDTKKNRILTFREPYAGNKVRNMQNFASWLTPTQDRYCHLNSIFATDDRVYALAHNETYKTGKTSQLFVYDRGFNRLLDETIDTGCFSAHNFYKDADRELICNSQSGSLLCNGSIAFKCDNSSFTRGLSVAEDYVLLGSSGISPLRNNRNNKTAHVYILDRDFRKVGRIDIDKAQVMDIRRVDVPDLGLSNER